jgi:hypothetical protein
MNSERERLLKVDKRCWTCEHFKQAKYGLSRRFPDVAGFCTRVEMQGFWFTADMETITTDIESIITTTAGSSCGFWRKK